MPKQPVGTCPVTEDYRKWWLRRSNLNAEALKAEGKAMKASNYTVTEEQVNRQFNLVPKTFQPGRVLAKLQECGIPVVDQTPGELKLAWNPRLFSQQEKPAEQLTLEKAAP